MGTRAVTSWHRRGLVVLSLAALAACSTPDPKEAVDLKLVESYWAIDSQVGTMNFIAPVARLELTNKTNRPLHGVLLTAAFRRKGEEGKEWGSAWESGTPPGKPLAPGQKMLIILKSDGRYSSTGVPSQMVTHAIFKDARVEVFVRVGRTGWVKMVSADIERRIGSRSVEELGK
jgi:hypothetical protein